MTGFPTPCVGAVMSGDVAVPEHERVVAFYSRVLTTGEKPFWREDLMNNVGIPVVGVGQRTPEYEQLPLQWMPHIQVADVAKSVEVAQSLGGVELVHGKDDDGRSQWAVLQDPNGAAFGIIPVVPAEAMPPAADLPPLSEMGRIAWLDVTSPDAAATRDFYEAVVGWTTENVPMEDADGSYFDYALCGADGNAVAGSCHARGVNGGLPGVWLICLPVGDLGESLERVRAEGGEVVEARHGDDGDPTYAVIRDPVGAAIALLPG